MSTIAQGKSSAISGVSHPRSKAVRATSSGQATLENLTQVTFFDTAGKKIRLKPSKVVIAQLREMCYYLRPQLRFNNELSSLLMGLIKECSDNDVDRKVIRFCFFLIIDMASNDFIRWSNQLGEAQKALGDLNNVISLEIREQSLSPSIRLCLAWRNLGRGITQRKDNRTTTVLEICSNTFQELVFPEKPKSTILSNKKGEKDYEVQLLLWSSVLSTMRRTGLPPKASSLKNLTLAVSATNSQNGMHPCMEIIQDHALNIVLVSVKHLIATGDDLTAYVSLMQQFFKRAKAQRSGIGSAAGGSVGLSSKPEDMLSYSVVLQILNLLSDKSDLQDDIIVDLYESAWHLLAGFVVTSSDSIAPKNLKLDGVNKDLLSLESLKIFSDVVRFFLEHRRAELLIHTIGPKNSTGAGLVAVLVNSLTQRLLAVKEAVSQRIDNSNTSLLINMLSRTASRLGRWLNRNHIVTLDRIHSYPLRDSLIGLLQIARQQRFKYSPINSDQPKNVIDQGKHACVLLVEALVWLLPSIGTTSSDYSLEKYIALLLRDDALDPSLRIQILSQTSSRVLAMSNQPHPRHINPTSVVKFIALIIESFQKYPSRELLQLIQQSWTAISHILHNMAASATALSTTFRNISSVLRSELYNSFITVREMDMKAFKLGSANHLYLAVRLLRDLQREALWMMSDNICLWLRDDLENFSVPVSRSSLLTLPKSPPSATAALISSLSVDTSVDLNPQSNTSAFAFVSVGDQATDARGKVPRRVLAILALLNSGLTFPYGDDGLCCVRGLIRAAARFAEMSTESTSAELLCAKVMDTLQNFIDNNTIECNSDQQALRIEVHEALYVLRKFTADPVTHADKRILSLLVLRKDYSTGFNELHVSYNVGVDPVVLTSDGGDLLHLPGDPETDFGLIGVQPVSFQNHSSKRSVTVADSLDFLEGYSKPPIRPASSVNKHLENKTQKPANSLLDDLLSFTPTLTSALPQTIPTITPTVVSQPAQVTFGFDDFTSINRTSPSGSQWGEPVPNPNAAALTSSLGFEASPFSSPFPASPFQSPEAKVDDKAAPLVTNPFDLLPGKSEVQVPAVPLFPDVSFPSDAFASSFSATTFDASTASRDSSFASVGSSIAQHGDRFGLSPNFSYFDTHFTAHTTPLPADSADGFTGNIASRFSDDSFEHATSLSAQKIPPPAKHVPALLPPKQVPALLPPKPSTRRTGKSASVSIHPDLLNLSK